MLIKKPADIQPSEITPEGVYFNRRQFMLGSAGLLLSGETLAALASKKKPAVHQRQAQQPERHQQL